MRRSLERLRPNKVKTAFRGGLLRIIFGHDTLGHSFRHATAVHLVAAGVDITVIRSWLGQVRLDTTNHYAQANLETKRKALDRIDTSSKARRPPRWKRDTSVLAWLDSL